MSTIVLHEELKLAEKAYRLYMGYNYNETLTLEYFDKNMPPAYRDYNNFEIIEEICEIIRKL